MSSVLGEILLILLLILANGMFAMAEMAIVSSRKARLQQRADEGDARARVALDLAATPNRFLSTTQIGITLIATLAGALGGATLSGHLAGLLDQVTWLRPYSDGLALALVVLVIAYLSLVVGELAPKRIAMGRPERIAMALAGPMHFMSGVVRPAVHLLSGSTDLLLRLLGVRASDEPPVTQEEIQVLLEEGAKAGVFQEAQQDMVESVLDLHERRASALMTPRLDITYLDLEDPPEEIRRKIIASPYSRFPVCCGSLDDVMGEVETRDLLAHSLAGKPFDLKALLQKPLYVPEVMPALQVLEALKQSGTQMALVIDEYGSVQGLVTLNDILEAIVGDIPTPEDQAEPQIVQREDGSWLFDGMVDVQEFKEVFGIRELPGEDQGLYQTLGGFVTLQIGHVPAAAEHFQWEGYRFEVMDMDGNRVDKVLVVPPAPADDRAKDEG